MSYYDETYKRMKKEVKAAYNNGPTWCNKVDHMPKAQLVSIYHSLLNQKKVRNVY